MMARIETLSAYRCTFSYLQRNNPLKEELQVKISHQNIHLLILLKIFVRRPRL